MIERMPRWLVALILFAVGLGIALRLVQIQEPYHALATFALTLVGVVYGALKA
jgi:hypothetical protein